MIRSLLTTAITLGLAVAANAAPLVTIDNFTRFALVYDVTNDGVEAAGPAQVDASFLGTRTIYGNRIQGGQALAAASGGGIGSLDVPSGPSLGSARFAYVTAPFNFGFTNGQFRVDADTDRVSLTGGNIAVTVNGVTVSQLAGGEALTSYFFNFSDFAGVNFANVTDIQLMLSANERGTDINVYTFEASEIPEPSTMFVVGAGLIAVGLFRRRR